MGILNNVLFWINIVRLIFILGSFFFQLLFGCLLFLKPRKYKKAEKYHDFTIIIRARNEAEVIADAVDSCRKLDYPKDKFRVVVFCHNCTDNTAEIVRQHGGRAIEIFDDNPKHRKASYCRYYGRQELKKEGEGKYEYFCFIDADNQLDKNYLNACNDAADSGVELGRTFENSKNFTENIVSCRNGLYYIRDDQVACKARSARHIGCVRNGCASRVKAEYALDWDAMSSSDDIEFTLNRLIKDGKKVEYIDQAVVYEDQPTSISEMAKRNARMGHGLFRLYFTLGFKCLELFFKNLFKKDVLFSTKLSYLDQYCNISIVPASLVAAIWIPLYYIYALIYTGLGHTRVISGVGSYNLRWFVWFIVIALCVALIIPFFVQPIYSYFSVKKRLFVTNKKVLVASMFLVPFYRILQAAPIFKGIFTNPKWAALKRSKNKIKQ